jgi:ABC-2 type transport system ATP-binding protein
MACASISIHDSDVDERLLMLDHEMMGSNPANGSRSIAVSVEDVSKTYPVPFLRLKKFLRRKFKPPVEAIRNASFDIREGEIFGLIGPNGAGKTTLTKIIATLIQPTSGTVTVKGHDSVSDDERVRLNVGLAGAEERSFYWRLTSEQNLLFFARLYGLSGSDARRRIKELFELFEFDELARRRFAELSTGNKQRLSVARAMLANPPVLLLDEPTRSLDPIAAARMRTTIQSLAQNKDRRVTIFLTSHNLAEVEELCDRVAIIGKGEIKAIDSPANLRTLHTEEESVSISFTSLVAADAEHALRQAFTDRFFTLERAPGDQHWRLRFSRGPQDETLDSVLRVLQQSGAVVRSVETERATLLDVLESYEQPND